MVEMLIEMLSAHWNSECILDKFDVYNQLTIALRVYKFVKYLNQVTFI